MKRIRINSVKELFEIIIEENKNQDKWFRGQSNSDYNLCPKVFRNAIIVEDFYFRPIKPRILYGESYEATKGFRYKICNPYLLVRYFKEELNKKYTGELKDENDLSVMCLGQHYGLPTTLLDWTTDALVGLYFSLPEEDIKVDSALFILNPKLLNRDKGIPNYSDLKDCFSNINTTIAFHGPRDNPRICRQSGNFTFHGDYDYFRLDLYTDTDKYLTKIIIKHELHRELKRYLKGFGINSDSIYINKDYKDELGKITMDIEIKEIKTIVETHTAIWEETPDMERGMNRRHGAR